jgi:hypothetical protein
LVGGCAVIEAQTIPKSVFLIYAMKNALPAIGVVNNLYYQHANEFHAWHMERVDEM